MFFSEFESSNYSKYY